MSATPESLHTHTTLSDGKMTHREMFDLAESLGTAVIAFTDHDAVPSLSVMAELETLRNRTTKWIVGIEITADLPQELKPAAGAMHIIGLFTDPANEALVKHCQLAQEARRKRMHQIVSNLKNLGFKISEEDCLEMSGGESVGRPHIVQALNKYPENNLVTEKIRLEMAHEASQNPELKKHYDHMMQRGESQYPYALYLSPNSFRTAYAEHEYMPDLDEAVALIRGAGGVAILAHYFTIRAKMPFEALERILSEKRLDGVEIIYGLREYGTDRENEINLERNTLRAMAQKYGAITAGGSDAHTAEDLERYTANTWFSNESAGFTKKIIASGRVNKSFSSLL